MIESITFDTAAGKLIVTTDEGTTEYTTRAAYLADYPDREADCDAMEWPS